uniref:PIN domain-containing protein n=1 Tax=Candidatus Kentrum sp. MB TaxID=2138164 RepID=A0A450WZQ6_9GAMM|nr:MAG: hypothetical protein BECKMB1821G_GA0114241_100245 [Candidatus Kentron sp. MB]
MLLDTDVLIWYMRGDGNARDLIEGLPNITLCWFPRALRGNRIAAHLRRIIPNKH